MSLDSSPTLLPGPCLFWGYWGWALQLCGESREAIYPESVFERWQDMLEGRHFTEVTVQPLEHEAGIACARRPARTAS